jgi:WD40 repeat protein
MREIASIRYNNVVAMSPDGQWVAYDGEDNIIRVRDVTAGSESTRIMTGHPVYSLVVSPDGKWIAAAGRDAEEEHVSVWELATGRKTSDVQHAGYIVRLTFSPNGNWVVSGSEDGTVRIWESSNGSVVASVNHDSPVYSVAFSSDGRYMASGSGEYYLGYVDGDSDYFPHGTMAIWDTFAQKEIARIPYDDPIDALVFSPDGQWILNNLGYISNVSTGMDVGLIAHGNGAVFSPDGKWIVTNSGRFLNFWLWRPKELVADLCSRLPRNLTRAEWNFYVGKEPYRATCTNLPTELEFVPTPSQ